MKVNLQGGFTYRAYYMINEEAYTKLLSTAEAFGMNNASTILDLYLESKVYNHKCFDKYAMMMLKNSIISFETHFPSNFVTVTACVTDCEAEVDPCHDRYEDVKAQLDAAFAWRVDILNFIRGELDANGIIDKE